MTSRKSPPDEWLKIAAEAKAYRLAAKMPEWRKAWAALPQGFRETLFNNAKIDKARAGEPLQTLSIAEMNALLLAAGRYADFCIQAESWLLKEREARK